MKALLVAVLVASSAISVATERAASPARLDSFVRRALHLNGFRAAQTDLNGDGLAEAIVYATDDGFCGSGGCTLFILAPDRTTYRVISKITVTRPPVRLLVSSTHGWRDLSVTVAGGGITTPYEARLRYDGSHYPSNPTLPAMRLRMPRGQTILE